MSRIYARPGYTQRISAENHFGGEAHREESVQGRSKKPLQNLPPYRKNRKNRKNEKN
jgi:hypothetical protein